MKGNKAGFRARGSGSRLHVISSPISLSANERQLMSLIRRHRKISRADLARLTGLALPSVSRLTANLMELGLVASGVRVATGPGQPSLPLSLSRGAAFSLGLSVRADEMALTVIDLDGTTVAALAEPIDASDKHGLIARADTLVAAFEADGLVDRDRLFGMGVAFSGFFTGSRGALATPIGMEGWALTDLEAAFSDRLGLPVWIENDGTAAAAAEALYGVGESVGSFAYIYIDQGLGGGVVLDGKPWRGLNGNAGEFTGLLPPAVRDHRPNLVLLLKLANDRSPSPIGMNDLVARIDPDGPVADAWLALVAPQMDEIVSAIAATIDPELIVVGGRLPARLADRLIAGTRYYSVPVRNVDRSYPPIRRSLIAGDALSLGAASLPFSANLF